MQVLIASRKNTHLDGVLPPTDPDQSRVPFEDVLRKSTVLVLSLPRNAQTLNLLSTPEFEMMSPYTMIVNVARGGIVDEAALLKALQDGQISGYGTDVLDKEPAEGPEDCVLFSEEAKSLNIAVSPHLAWFAGTTLANIARILKETVGAWAAGEPINVIV
jgi:glycerate dehydrogenase